MFGQLFLSRSIALEALQGVGSAVGPEVGLGAAAGAHVLDPPGPGHSNPKQQSLSLLHEVPFFGFFGCQTHKQKISTTVSGLGTENSRSAFGTKTHLAVN